MVSSALLTAVLLSARSADLQFHDWCTSNSITTPLARLETSPKSVAGRGIFASDDIQEGDVVMTIPEGIVLHEFNAASSFPRLGNDLFSKIQRFEDAKRGRRRWWHRFTKRQPTENYEFTDSSDLWQATLTIFSLACLEVGDGEGNNPPWAHWISQWRRTDPMQSLFEKSVTWRDEEDVLTCVDQLSQMLPDVSKTKLRAAVEMRLGRLEELKTIFDIDDDDNSFSRMFGVLTSRAIELGDNVLGILPMFDMLNHSNDPNLALSFDGENFALWGRRKIAKGEELFVSYKDLRDKHMEWDEDDAIWMLVQWGIPMPKPTEKEAGTGPTKNEIESQLLFA